MNWQQLPFLATPQGGMWSSITLNLHMFSSIWIIHWATNGSTSRFRLRASIPSCPFQHAFWRDIWNTSCLNFIMFWPKGKCLAYNLTNPPSLSIIFPNFFHNALNVIWTTPSLNCEYPLMCVHTSHRPYGYPPLTMRSWQWAHGNPWCSL
jgi:hypothetical protein